MYLDSLTLINIRSFSQAEIKFSRSINLLVGNNNSGKSTVIKAAYLLQNFTFNYQRDIRKLKEFGRIYIDLKDISKNEQSLFLTNQKETRHKFPDTEQVTVGYGLYTSLIETQRGHDAWYFDKNTEHIFDDTHKVIFKDGNPDNNHLIEFTAFPDQQTQNNFIYPFLAKRKTNYYSNSSFGEKDSFRVSDDLRNITSKVQVISNPSHPKYNEFLYWMNEILGFSIGVIPSGERELNTGIYVREGIMIPIENMGEGVVNILGLIIMLLTEDRKLYLIEELENDIHPGVLKKLLELIVKKSESNQFIISTHSNIVLKYLGIESAKIFGLSWQPFETEKSDQLPTSGIYEVENAPEHRMKLLEELGYDIFDFDLYKSYLIFEESSAESLVRDFLIPVFVPELSGKLRTIAASGADDIVPRFADFLRLFVFVHQTPVYQARAWVLADGDEAGRNTIERLKDKFTSWPPEHFLNLSRNNIEDYYPERFSKEVAELSHLTKNKQEKKKYLIIKLLKWISENPDDAKTEFSQSAKEIIDILKRIKVSLNKKK